MTYSGLAIFVVFSQNVVSKRKVRHFWHFFKQLTENVTPTNNVNRCKTIRESLFSESLGYYLSKDIIFFIPFRNIFDTFKVAELKTSFKTKRKIILWIELQKCIVDFIILLWKRVWVLKIASRFRYFEDSGCIYFWESGSIHTK